MIRLIFSYLIFCTSLINMVMAQPLDITRGGLGARLRSQPIQPTEGRMDNGKLLNLRTNRFSRLNSSISGNGKVLVLEDQLIKDESISLRKIDIPFSNRQTFRGTLLSSVNNILVIKESGSEGNINASLHFFNIDTEDIVAQYTSPLLSFVGLSINSDASTFVFLSAEGLVVVNRKNGTFESTLVSTGFVRQDITHFSSSGDRIFFYGRKQALDDSKYFIIDRLETGWSEPKELHVFDGQNNDLRLGLVDIANNGRTLLVTNSEIGYSLTHEVDGNWSIPQSTGYIPVPFDSAQISENGKVIAIQTAKRITEIVRFYDVFLLLQNPAGQWIQRQVNDPQLEVHDGILLSDDGTQLFWLPANTSSVPGAEDYR